MDERGSPKPKSSLADPRTPIFILSGFAPTSDLVILFSIEDGGVKVVPDDDVEQHGEKLRFRAFDPLPRDVGAFASRLHEACVGAAPTRRGDRPSRSAGHCCIYVTSATAT